MSTGLRNVAQMLRYASENHSCRRQLLLGHFDESFDPARCRFMCDNCLGRRRAPLRIDCAGFVPGIRRLFGELGALQFKPGFEFVCTYLSSGRVPSAKNSGCRRDWSRLSLPDPEFRSLTAHEIVKLVLELIVKGILTQELIRNDYSGIVVLSLNASELGSNSRDKPIWITRENKAVLPLLLGAERDDNCGPQEHCEEFESQENLKAQFGSQQSEILSSFGYFSRFLKK